MYIVYLLTTGLNPYNYKYNIIHIYTSQHVHVHVFLCHDNTCIVHVHNVYVVKKGASFWGARSINGHGA